MDEVIANCETALVYDALIFSYLNDGDELLTLGPVTNRITEKADYFNKKVRAFDYKIMNNQFEIDFEALSKQITKNTRFLLVRDPDYVTGKVLSKNESNNLVALLKEHPQLYLIVDRETDFLINRQFDLLSTNPDVFNRSIFLYSGEKMFNARGWRIGWTIGAAELIKYVPVFAQWMRFNPNTPSMVAFAHYFREVSQKDLNAFRKEQVELFRQTYDDNCEKLKNFNNDLKIVPTELKYNTVVDVNELKSKLELGGDGKTISQASAEFLNEQLAFNAFESLNTTSIDNTHLMYRAYD